MMPSAAIETLVGHQLSYFSGFLGHESVEAGHIRRGEPQCEIYLCSFFGYRLDVDTASQAHMFKHRIPSV